MNVGEVFKTNLECMLNRESFKLTSVALQMVPVSKFANGTSKLLCKWP